MTRSLLRKRRRTPAAPSTHPRCTGPARCGSAERLSAERILALSVLLATAIWSGCSTEIRSETPEEEETRQLTGLAEAPEEAVAEAPLRTQLYSEHDADVYSRLSDITTGDNGVPVVEIRVEIGDRVRKGQVLAVLDDADARLAVDAARPRAEEAERRYERLRQLVEREMVSQAQYEEALYEHRSAAAALRRAELELDRTRVRAPFDGVVARRYVRVGRTVHEGEPLFRVTAMAPLRARLLVVEERAKRFQRGDPVTLEDESGRRGRGRVILVGPTVDPASGTREVVVELTDPDGFRPGAAVTVQLQRGDSSEETPAEVSAARGGSP